MAELFPGLPLLDLLQIGGFMVALTVLVVQVAKRKIPHIDAEIVSIVVGALLAAAGFLAIYVPAGYPQWFVFGVYVILLALAPSGGFDLLKEMLQGGLTVFEFPLVEIDSEIEGA